LIERGNYFAAFGSEDAGGGGVYFREEFALHAAEEQTHASTLLAFGRSDFWRGFSGAELRHKRFHGAQLFRQ